MPIICAIVPSFRLAVALHDHTCEPSTPALLADKLERGHVVDLSAQAQSLGARIGMTLTQAQACVREAQVLIDDRSRTRTVWEAMLDALDAASPLVEDAAEGTAFIDMRGIEGTPERWMRVVREALVTFPYPLRIGCAENKFTARAAACLADEATCSPGKEAALLAPMAITLLDIDNDTCERLLLLGIQNLGELAALPHGPLARRFGPAAERWHRLAQGIDRTPLIPRPRALRIDHTLYGEGTADREEQLLFALRTLVNRVADDLVLAGQRCGSLHVTLECEDGDAHDITCTLAQSTAQPALLFDLLKARIEGVILQSPVVGLRLGAAQLEEGGKPLSLFPTTDPDPEALQVMLARLDAALGEGHTQRAVLAPGTHYETQFRREPFTYRAAPEPTFEPQELPDLPHYAVMQFRLIDAEPVDVRIYNGAPAFVGTPPQAVLDYAGPWRIDERWWERDALARDDYDVLLEDGSLYRISRTSDLWSITGCYD